APPARLPAKLSSLVLAVYAAYMVALVMASSFHLGGARWFVLNDDMMISMRYARHLREGHGLVWNLGGPRVEGFTNPSWTLFRAPAPRFPFPPAHRTLPVQLTGILLALAGIVFIGRIASELAPRSPWTAPASMFLAACYYPLNQVVAAGF